MLIVSTDQAHSLGRRARCRRSSPTGRARADAGARRPGRGRRAAASSTRWRWTPWRCWKRGGARSPGCCRRGFPSRIWETLPPKSFRRYRVSRRCSACTRSASWPPSGEWDHVVVDCASTADALRMLTLPATFGLYLERAWPRHRRLSLGRRRRRARRRSSNWSSASPRAPSELSALLTDGDRVSAHLVLTAERVVAAEAARTLGALALMGVSVDELHRQSDSGARRFVRIPQSARAPRVRLVLRADLRAAGGARRTRRHHR